MAIDLYATTQLGMNLEISSCHVGKLNIIGHIGLDFRAPLRLGINATFDWEPMEEVHDGCNPERDLG